jgi:hypothetical protein
MLRPPLPNIGRISSMTPKISLLALLLLTSCNTLSGPPTPKAICDATIGPIRYNTAKLSSSRHAGPVLALDLKAHNQVGRSLGCPNY